MQNPVLAVVKWYRAEGRPLPWRETKDPYRIWLSEVILQQTRIDQGTAYYERFVSGFPTVHDLAEAETDTVMKYWEGLGYYSRARNLHATAKEVSSTYKGIFPNDYRELMKLKGIGPYTSRAIGSIAFGNEVGVVDGNVQRVLSRYCGDSEPIDSPVSKNKMQALLDEWIQISSSQSKESLSSEFNQGMMDLGALVCKPVQPRCDICPIRMHCVAFQEGTQAEYPVKKGKLQRKTVYYHFYLIQPELGKLWVQRRPEKGVWGGLWEIPNAEVDEREWNHAEQEGLELRGAFKHVFTHMDMMIKVYSGTESPLEQVESTQLIASSDLEDLGFSRAVLKIFERFLPQKS